MPKRVAALILILILIFSITACGLQKKDSGDASSQESEPVQETQANMRRTVFYFVNEHDLLVPVTRDIPWVEGIAKSALESLVDTPEIRAELEPKGLKPPLPSGTKVLGMTIRDGIAKVDFSREFLNLNGKTAEQNAIKAVVYTLTEFPSVQKVQLMVEGKPLKKCPNGTILKDELQREKINLEPGAAAEGNNMVPVMLYFRGSSSDGNFTYYVPVTRMVKKSDNLMKTALEELIKGPVQGMGLSSVIPADTKVLDVSLKENEAIVNFSKEIEGYGGGVDTEQALVNTVVLTLSEFPGVEKVTIQVEGKSGVLPEGTILDTPILKPAYINPANI
ncbi:GerMN domain-containing protein [Thermosediminibacter oceani]|uniref:Lipoprotein LpqB, GerMN domain protein n=1 Tax=Thermosediminibacter oceani (strain ATCC BAA-1034 / DSM 16646 / JW/IW-1228P) TaxID=555079 RepID=D9RYU4_THEOJ|nr:GerMN domain-containing protein [Thermosediminibacter oceani]ADL08518.1 Lipoprotein LpqB, GerMN domain protein [Thermosediminibacter oceani DSM 16646]